jgi:hypothetical protein
VLEIAALRATPNKPFSVVWLAYPLVSRSSENMVSNAVIGFDLSNTDKYRFNATFNCTAPFVGGTAVNAEHN